MIQRKTERKETDLNCHLHEVIRGIFCKKATFKLRFELSKRKKNRGKELYLCSVLEGDHCCNLLSAAFEQRPNENSYEPRTRVFEPVFLKLPVTECMLWARHCAKWAICLAPVIFTSL